MIKPTTLSNKITKNTIWKQHNINRLGLYFTINLYKQITYLMKSTTLYIIDLIQTTNIKHILCIKLKYNLNKKKINKPTTKTIKTIIKTWTLLLYILNNLKKHYYALQIKKKLFFYFVNIIQQTYYSQTKKQALTIKTKLILKTNLYSTIFFKNWSVWLSFQLQQNKWINGQLLITNLFNTSVYNNRWQCIHKTKYITNQNRLRKRLLETLFFMYVTEISKKAGPCLTQLIRIIKKLKLHKLRKFSIKACKIWQNNLRILRLASLIHIKGYKLYLNGKIKRSMRKGHYIATFSTTSTQNFNTLISYTNGLLITRVGSINANLWIFF